MLEYLKSIESKIQWHSYDKRVRVFAEGDAANRVYVLRSGTVRVFHESGDGSEVLVRVFRAPAMFGHGDALRGDRYIENVETIERCEIGTFDVADLRTLLATDAKAAGELLVDMAEQLALVSRNQKSIAFDPINKRAANYLLEYASWSNPPGTEQPILDVTQDDIAAAVGSTRRSICSALSMWQAEGVIERRRSRYVIRDSAALERDRGGNSPQLSHSLK